MWMLLGLEISTIPESKNLNIRALRIILATTI